MVKKIMNLLLVFALLFTFVGCNKKEKDEFDEYVKNNFYEIASLCEIDPKSLKVQTGIEVVNLRNEGRFYPVYQDGELAYVLEVYKVDGELGYAFPGNAIDLVSKVFEINDKEFVVFAVFDSIFAYVNDSVIDFRTGQIIDPKDFKLDIPETKTYSPSTINFKKH